MPATFSPPSRSVSSAADAPSRRYRVLVVATHPVQYTSPIWSGMARHPQLDVTVAYCSLQGARPGNIDSEFGTEVQWDIPLLEGYPWVEVQNRARHPGIGGFFGFTNPGLWKIVRKGSFDAIEIFTGYVYASFWITLLAAKTARVPVLFGTDATSLDPRQGRRWKRLVKRIIWPLLFRLADQVIVPSTGGRELMKFLGIPEDRVTLTPYVVDNERWLVQSARADRAAIRASWGATAEDPVVLFCAKLQSWKGPLDLLRAFARAAVPKARLVFAGEGPLRGRLEAEAAALGIRDRTLFLGFVNQSELPAVYTAADLMVLPSSYEPFAVVVNEAMLCGCPVAASDRVGAARDLIVPGQTGFVFPCGDISALSALLQKAFSDRDRLREIAHAAFQRMASWSPRENIAGQISAIARAVHRRPPCAHSTGGLMKWYLQNFFGRLSFAVRNPRYAVRSVLRDLAGADERFLSSITGSTTKRLRAFLGEPASTPEFAAVLRGAESAFRVLEIRSADLYAKKVLVQYAAVRAFEPEVVVETGVANGVSTSYLLLALRKNGRGTLHSIELGDPRYLPVGKPPGWLVPDWLKPQWNLLIGDSRERLPKLLAQLGSIDVFIHDSLHSYDQMLWEYRAAFPFIRPGGLLFSDDATWNPAFAEFCREVSARQAGILRGVGFLQKNSP